MKLFTELVSDKVSDAFEKAGYDREFGAVSISKRTYASFSVTAVWPLQRKKRRIQLK